MRFFINTCVLAMVLTGALFAPGQAQTMDAMGPLEDEQRLLALLHKRVTCDFERQPFSVIADFVSRNMGLPIHLDSTVSRDGAFDGVPLTLAARDVQLHSALSLLLDRLDCTWTIHKGTVFITSLEREKTLHMPRVYNVADLPGRHVYQYNMDGYRYYAEEHDLVDVVQSSIDPDSWSDAGGDGNFFAFHNMLVVRQTFRNHLAIADLLRQIRNLQSGRPARVLSPAETQIETALASPIHLNCMNGKLAEIAQHLRLQCNINVVIDEEEIRKDFLALNPPLTLVSNGQRLDACLDRLLTPYGLAYTVQHEVLYISSQSQAEDGLRYARVIPALNIGPHAQDNWELLEQLQQTVLPESWFTAKGYNKGDWDISPFAGMWVVRQSYNGHRQLDTALGLMRIMQSVKPQP